MVDDENLFSDFPKVATSDWEAKIRTDLKGADYNKKLIWKTIEGFDVHPYYRNENIDSLDYLNQIIYELPVNGNESVNPASWRIRQDILVNDVVQANQKALDILQKGITSIGFVFGENWNLNASDLEKLLDGIHLSAIEINFICEEREFEFVSLFTNYVHQKAYDVNQIFGSLNYDPTGYLVKRGAFSSGGLQPSLDTCITIIQQLKSFQNFQAITIHGSYFTNAGSSIVQSLAFSLAISADYLDWLTDAGFTVDDIAKNIKFNFAISSNYFMEIARFRAARWLWAKILESYGVKRTVPMQIHAETCLWNKTVYDPYVNILRSTTEAMSAAIGRVDSITVIPFDITYERPTDIAERIARNTQIILQEEAYFNKIIDASAGSYYIESITDSVITEAWKLFLEIQDKGGFIEAFKEGFVQEKIKEIAIKRTNAIATRREILLGTNQFPNFGEVINCEINDESYSNYNVSQNLSQHIDHLIAEPLKFVRGAEAFEKLRHSTDMSGKRPKVFMVPIGNVSLRKARTTFACNFFACAGFQVIDNDGFNSTEEGIQAAKDENADIVVICSSDDEYATLAPETFRKLDHKVIFVVAGEPSCKADLEAKGIKNFISIKSNVLDSLIHYKQLLGLI